MSDLPPAGWYDDPEYPGYLRYWGGDGWSEHRSATPTGAMTSTPSGLSAVGQWLNQSFRVLWERRNQMLVVLIANIAVTAIFSIMVARIWADLLWDGHDWTGFSGGRVWATIGLLLLMSVATGFLYLVVCHQLYSCRLALEPSLGVSVAAALKALPRAIGWFVALAVAAVVAIVAVVVLSAVNVGLGLLGGLALVIGGVWAFVKLAFLAPALIIPVDGQNPIQSSANVSRSRFWPVLGRLLLLALVTFGVSVGLSLMTAPFTATDGDAIEQYFVVENDELVLVDIGGLIDEMNLGGPASMLATLPGVVTTLISLAGASVIFAETYQVRPDGPDHAEGRA